MTTTNHLAEISAANEAGRPVNLVGADLRAADLVEANRECELARTGAYLYQAVEGADWAGREQLRRNRLNMAWGQDSWLRNG